VEKNDTPWYRPMGRDNTFTGHPAAPAGKNRLPGCSPGPCGQNPPGLKKVYN
jgi:hypothetical protein